jgi:enamine deaminase RidA (YjgF/YER057c/UK114 family)
MTRRVINPDTLAQPVGHFDRAVQVGPWLFISGTSALTHLKGPIGERRLSPSIEEQARQTMENIKRVCDAAGYRLEDIFEIRFTLKRREDFGAVDSILKEYLPERGFIAHGYQGELLSPEMLIEVEANAYRD